MTALWLQRLMQRERWSLGGLESLCEPCCEPEDDNIKLYTE